MEPVVALYQWTIYHGTSDYPPWAWVVRAWTILPGALIPSPEASVALSLEEARAYVPRQCVRLERMPGDDPTIVEVWT